MAILHHFRKPRAKYDVIFEEDLDMDEDGWFIRVKRVQKTNGKYAYESCIIRKDIPDWVSPLIRDGYTDLIIKSTES